MLKNITISKIILIGIVIRILCLCFYPDPMFGDSMGYEQEGQHLLTHGTIKAIHVMPLYPLLAGLTGGGIYLKCLDVLFGVFNIFLLYRLSLLLFSSEKIAKCAALVSALYPHFIFFSVSRLTETSYITLTLLALICLYEKRWIWGCVFLILGVLERPTFDLLNPLLIALFAFCVHRLTLLQTGVRVFIYACIYMVFLTPWWIHNFHKYHTFVRLNLGDGIVWYSGNNPLNHSGGGVATGHDDDMDLSVFNHIQDPILRNERMKHAAFEFIKENPMRFMKLASIKFMRFWRLWPYTESYQSLSIILISVLSYGPILILFIGFLLFDLKHHLRKCMPLLAMIGYLTLVHMILIGSIRYRVPIEPLLIIFASYRFISFQGSCSLRKHAVNASM